MTAAGGILNELRDLGVELWAEGDRLRYRGPAGALTPALRARMQALKPELLRLAQAAPQPEPPEPELADAIPRVPDADSYAASEAQRRLWVLSQLDDAGAAYHVAIHLRLDGPLDRDALTRALERLADRHEALRTRFVLVDGTLHQQVAAPGGLQVRQVDAGTGRAAEERARALARDELRTPFDLEAGPPVRAVVAAMGAHRHALLLTMHHIAVDGWSLSVLLRELSLLYRAGEADKLPALPVQYRDFAQWQNRLLDGAAATRMRSYWLNKLAGRTGRLDLPTRPRPPRQTFRGDMAVFAIGAARTAGLQALLLQRRTSLFMGLCALVKCLLHRYTGQQSIAIGTPVAGRDHPDLDGQVGHYLNILVLLDAVDGRQSFASLLAAVRRTVLEAFEHRQYPFNRLVDELGAERDSSRNPVFDVMVSLQNAGKLELALPGITASGLFEEPATSKLDLTFDFEDIADGLILGIRYNSDLFGAGSIDAMGRHFQSLLDSVLANADQTVAALALMPPAEYRQVVYDFNETAATYPHDATLVALFDRQAAATPGHIAIVDGHERLTYADLAARSQRIASLVAAAGQSRGSVVGLLADRSAWLPAAMLGVLRAGAAYVPMDIAHPPARLAATIRASGCRIVLTKGAPAIPEIAGVTFVPVDRAGADLAETGAGPRAGDPAYVIFTSGTTGAPKGVVVTHGNAVAFLSAMAAEPGCGTGDTLLSVTTPSFDIYGLEIFLPLTTGGRVVLAGRDDATDGGRLAELIASERVTMMQATPAMWRLLCDAGWTGDGRLRMLCGGEALPPALAGSLISRGGPLWNLYGPTETTIWSTVARLADAGPPVPIGKPIGNTRVYVLDPGMRPVPIGIRGEIVIAGAGVARGYLGAPALTAQRFVPDPFRQGGRMYRTGDLGQWLPDGQLEYLGRADGQLKIRGHRIEAAEVEHALRGLGGVRDAAVAARPGPDGQAELCAYLVAAAPSLETSDLDTPGLRWALREALPSAMVPTRFVVLDRLPLMPNGKVDRRALPAPSPARSTSLPASEAERLLAAQWAEVLGVPAVGPDDDFFDLGGHSLMAMTLAGRISRSMGVNCTLADVFASPTVAALTARLRQRAPARFIPIKRIPDAPRYAASHAQRRLWVVSQSRRGSVAYNMMQTVLIEDAPGAEPLDTQALEAAFRGLIAAHEALRTTFQAEDDDLWQIVHPPETAAEFRIVPIDLSAEPMPEETARRLIAAEAATPFDLAAGPLLRAALMCAGPGRHVLTINMHHIVADAWSLRMMARELARNYRAARSGHDNPVPAPAIQCRDIAAWQAELDRQGILAAQRAYWLTKLAGVMPARLPADRPRPAEPGFGGATVIVTIQPDTVAALQRFGRSRRAGLFSVLLTAVNILIYRYTGCEDIVVGCVVAGRTVPELENQIGFHVNTLPLRSRVSGAASPGTLLPEIARTAADAFAHQEYPFDRLLADLPARGADQLFDVVVDYHEDDGEDASEAFGGLRLAPFAGRPPVAKFDLLFLFIRDRDGLRVTLEYATDLFNEARIAGMAGHFRQILGALLTDPERPVIELPLSGNAAAPAVRTHDDALAQFDFAEEQS